MASTLVAAAVVALAAVLAVLYGQPLLALLPKMESVAAQNRTVVVVGGGLAGMSAALEAALGGASVVLIDKEKRYAA